MVRTTLSGHPRVAEAFTNIDRLRGEDTSIEILPCPAVLHNRMDHQHAFASGLSAQELRPRGKAAGELTAVTDWILEQMGKSTCPALTESIEDAGRPRHTALAAAETTPAPVPAPRTRRRRSGRPPTDNAELRAKRKSTSVYIDNDVHKEIRQYCRMADITISVFIDDAIRSSLKKKLGSFKPSMPSADYL